MPRPGSISMASFALVIVLFHNVGAREPLQPPRTDFPPVIDGLLDDPAWSHASSVTGFTTWIPDYGHPMPGTTEVFTTYDSENLYFAFRCFDDEPDRIKSSVTARDQIESDDWICIHLDTFNDQQSLYGFYVNPLGIQMDTRAAVGDDRDYSIDLVWYSEGRIDTGGYTVEVRIPVKSIRFYPGASVEMGILFERNVSRSSMRGTWPGLDPGQEPNFFTQTRTLRYDGINRYDLVEVLPAITYDRHTTRELGTTARTNVSVTTKIGMTSDLVFDGAYNPDFSQVEADAGQVDFNLRYALFYEEKRPFFLEGKELFNFGAYSMSDPLQAVVHTRTIVDPLVGAKLIGKIGEKNTLASLYALDEPPDDSPLYRRAHVAILRYKRTLSSDSFVGGFGTARELGGSQNGVAGVDGQIRVGGPSRVGFHGFVSRTREKTQSLEKNGHAVGISVNYDTRDWHVDTRLRDLSEGFDTDVGYVTRTGIMKLTAVCARNLYPGSEVILRVDPASANTLTYDKDSGRWEQYNAIFIGATMPRNTYMRAGGGYRTEIFLGEEFDTSFLRIFLKSQVTGKLYVDADYLYGKKIRYVLDPYQGTGSSAAVSVMYQPLDKLNSGLDITYADFYNDGDGEKEFAYLIGRFKATYQTNKYLLFRTVFEYNRFKEMLMTDFLISFTYIPGTVLHVGYGSLYDKTRWENDQNIRSSNFHETTRGFFFKTSYLWRM